MDETHAGPPAELRIRSVDSDREPAVPSQPCVSDEELEQEPRLTYGRFGADVPNILATEAACRLCVSDKVLALGTKDGAVHLLDYDGNKIKSYREHKGPVTDLSFDASAESLASSSSDGSIAIYGLYTETVQKYTYRQAIQTIALDPRFSSRKSQEYIYGTATGTLVLSSRGWLGQSETVLFQGRGKVHAVRMAGTLLAWVTDTGLRVYDTSNHSRVGRIDRPGPSGAGTAAAECCSLEWVGQRELLLGWGAHVMAVAVTRRSTPQAGATPPQAQPSPGNSALPMGSAPAVWQLETTCCFPSDEGLVAGVAPFGSQLAVLVWNPPGTSNGIDSADDALEDGNGSIEPSSSGVTLRNGVSIVAPSSPATLKIYDRRGQELFSDAVELARLDASPAATCPVHLSAYVGAFSPPPRPPAGDAHSAVHPEAATPRPIQTRQRVEQPYKWWADGEEPLYYILGGKDIAIGRPRNSADRIAWLAERNRFPEAMAVADADREVGPAARLALGERYLQYLLSQKRYSEAAALCPSLLGKDAAAWERWVYEFAQVAKLALLAPHLPVADPQLSMSAYDLALNACLRATDDHSILLELVKNWPPSVYDAAALLRAIGPRAGPTSSFALRRSAAALHSNLGEHEAALRLLLDLKLPEAFEYIRANAVAPAAAPLAPQLIALDEVRGTSLLVDCWEEAPPAQVVAALQRAAEQEAAAAVAAAPAPGGREAVWPLRLYHYLDWLWQREPAAAAPFAATHVELCALYDPARLLHLLTSSSTYPLDAALEVCERQGLVRESVYVLGRMGSSDAALRLIVGRLRDVAGAVAFVQEQHDDELWELLISLTLGDAALAGELLDHAGGAVDPLRVVGALPEDMAIDRLRDRLVRIIGDFKAVMSLQQGCNAVLKADCLELADELYSRLRRAMRRVHMMRPGGRWVTYDALAGENEEESVPTVHIPDGTAQRVWVEIRPATPGGKGPRQVTPPVSVHSSPSKYPKRSPRRDARR